MTMLNSETSEKFDVEYYSYLLSQWIERISENPDEAEIKAICQLWDNESWESILKKYNTEGSVWYVWWFDGVHSFIQREIGVN